MQRMKNKSDDYWKSRLSNEQYQVLRSRGTALTLLDQVLKGENNEHA